MRRKTFLSEDNWAKDSLNISEENTKRVLEGMTGHEVLVERDTKMTDGIDVKRIMAQLDKLKTRVQLKDLAVEGPNVVQTKEVLQEDYSNDFKIPVKEAINILSLLSPDQIETLSNKFELTEEERDGNVLDFLSNLINDTELMKIKQNPESYLRFNEDDKSLKDVILLTEDVDDTDLETILDGTDDDIDELNKPNNIDIIKDKVVLDLGTEEGKQEALKILLDLIPEDGLLIEIEDDGQAYEVQKEEIKNDNLEIVDEEEETDKDNSDNSDEDGDDEIDLEENKIHPISDEDIIVLKESVNSPWTVKSHLPFSKIRNKINNYNNKHNSNYKLDYNSDKDLIIIK